MNYAYNILKVDGKIILKPSKEVRDGVPKNGKTVCLVNSLKPLPLVKNTVKKFGDIMGVLTVEVLTFDNGLFNKESHDEALGSRMWLRMKFTP